MTESEALRYLESRSDLIERLARKYCRSNWDDVAQEAKLKFWRLRDRIGATPDAYLTITIKHIAIEYLRKARHSSELHEDIHATRGDLDDAELRLAWWELERGLTKEAAYLLRRVCIEGWSYDEVAAYDGVELGTVKSRLFRARQAAARVVAGT